jgi:hypothetical protein
MFLMFNRIGWGFFLLIPAGIAFFGEVSGVGAIYRQRSAIEGEWKNSIETWSRNHNLDECCKRSKCMSAGEFSPITAGRPLGLPL